MVDLNGDVLLRELAKLAEEDKIPAVTFQRLAIAANMALLTKVDKLTQSMELRIKAQDTRAENIEASVNSLAHVLEDTVTALRNGQKDLEKRHDVACEERKELSIVLTTLAKNPFMATAMWFSAHPKWFWGLLIVFLILSNIWFVDDIRRSVMFMLHIPPEVIEMIVPGGNNVP